MDLTVAIPDDLARRLAADGDVARRALEAFAADEYRAGRLSGSELLRLLGFGTQFELDGFLKARGIYADYSMADLEQERADVARVGL